MSKRIIAGLGVVAGLAVALAPVGVFATDAESDEHTDRLNITVLPSCTFGNANLSTPDVGVTHTAGATVLATDGGTAPDWEATNSNGTGRTPDSDAGTNANKSDDTLTYSMFAGTTRDDLATTTLKVYCNKNEGYRIQAVTNALTEVTESETKATIPALASYSAVTSGYAMYRVGVDSDTDPMTVDQGSSATYVADSATTIAHKAAVSKATGDKLKITYGIGIQPSQKAATYEGTVVYTLLQGPTD